MLPSKIVASLTPNAAKVYLIFLSLWDRNSDPIIVISRPRLAQLATLSQRSCSRAIRLLLQLQLLYTIPHRFRQCANYVLLPVPRSESAGSPNSEPAQSRNASCSGTPSARSGTSEPLQSRSTTIFSPHAPLNLAPQPGISSVPPPSRTLNPSHASPHSPALDPITQTA